MDAAAVHSQRLFACGISHPLMLGLFPPHLVDPDGNALAPLGLAPAPVLAANRHEPFVTSVEFFELAERHFDSVTHYLEDGVFPAVQEGTARLCPVRHGFLGRIEYGTETVLLRQGLDPLCLE